MNEHHAPEDGNLRLVTQSPRQNWSNIEQETCCPNADDILTALADALVLSGTEFARSAYNLGAVLARVSEPQLPVLNYIELCWYERDPVAIAGIVYLLAHAHSSDLAVTAAWYALELGCDNDVVLIALADTLHLQPRPKQSALSLLQSRFSEGRSSAFHSKLADYYRDAGQAFLAEDMLRLLIGYGHQGITDRLAQHWAEFRDWRSVRDLLRPIPFEKLTAELTYLLGRSSLSLLLEEELSEAITSLSSRPSPGPQYAALLSIVWAWRRGDIGAVTLEALSTLDVTSLPSLLARDKAALHELALPKTPIPYVLKTNLVVTPGTVLPNVLGIGMQRTATSWLWQHLVRHPDVATPAFKESVFFSDLFGGLGEAGSDPGHLTLTDVERAYWTGPTRSLTHYLDLFQSTQPVRADISPTYGELPEETVAVVHRLLGSGVRILLSVRDPVERSWSNLKYDLMTVGHSAMTYSLEQRIAMYQSAATLRRCDYTTVLHTWRRYFNNIKIIFFDDVLACPSKAIAEVYRFLELPVPPNDDRTLRVNVSGEGRMPLEDRAFLFGLHQHTYRTAEVELGGPAQHWRQRQLRLLGHQSDSLLHG